MSEAKRITVPCGEDRRESAGESEVGMTCPTVRSLAEREERLKQHDPKTCTHKHCQPSPF